MFARGSGCLQPRSLERPHSQPSLEILGHKPHIWRVAPAAVGSCTCGMQALFSQQQTARSKVSAARQKKRSVAKKVQANNAHFKQSAHDFGEVVRVIVPGLKPTPPPPPPPPKKFFGLF